MTFIFRLLAGGLLFVVTVVVILVFLYVIVFVINRGIQWGAENIGGEIGDGLKWLKDRMPKIKIERKINDKKPESREIV